MTQDARTHRRDRAASAWWWILALVLLVLVVWATWGWDRGLRPGAASARPAPEVTGSVALGGGATPAPLA